MAKQSVQRLIRPSTTKFHTKLKSFNTVTKGAVATLEVDKGYTYEAIMLSMTNNGSACAKADFIALIDNIQLVIDGKTRWDLSGSDYINILAHKGVSVFNGVLPLCFLMDDMRTTQGADFTGLGTADLKTVTLKVKINASAVNPTLEARGIVSPNSNVGFIPTYETLNLSASAVGKMDYNDISTSPSLIRCLHAYTSNIDEVAVKYNKVDVVEEIPTAELKHRDESFFRQGRAWQTGVTHIDFMPSARFDDALAGNGGSLQLKLNMTATGAFNMVVERVEQGVK